MRHVNQKIENALPIIFLVLVPAAFFAKIIFSGETLYGSDFLFYFYPIKRFVYDYFLTNGSLPLWNPYLFSGTPFIVDIQAAMFYPLGFLYYVIPPETAYLYSTVLHCIVGAIFMYMFMRSLSASKWGAFLSGFIFIFNGYLMAHLYAGHPSFVQTYISAALIFISIVDLGSFSSPMIQSTGIKPLLNEGRLLRDIKEDTLVSRTAINGRCFIENVGLWYGFQDIRGYAP